MNVIKMRVLRNPVFVTDPDEIKRLLYPNERPVKPETSTLVQRFSLSQFHLYREGMVIKHDEQVDFNHVITKSLISRFMGYLSTYEKTIGGVNCDVFQLFYRMGNGTHFWYLSQKQVGTMAAAIKITCEYVDVGLDKEALMNLLHLLESNQNKNMVIFYDNDTQPLTWLGLTVKRYVKGVMNYVRR